MSDMFIGDNALSSPPAFEHAGLVPGTVRLRCAQAGTLPSPLIAWCNGAEAGRAERTGAVAAEDVLDIAIARLPCTPTPQPLRFALADAPGDLAPPLPLQDGRSPWALLGPGHPVVEELEAQHGVLRGRLVNRENGLFAPLLFARVNGGPARPVAAEPPRPRPDGASSIRFSITLRAEEISESGLHVEIFAEGVEGPVARWGLRPDTPGAAAESIAVLSTRLRAAEHAGALRDARLRLDLDRGLAERDARFEAFVEHVMGLIAVQPPAEARLGAPDNRLEAVRALIAGAVPPPAETLSERLIRAGGPEFTQGWHPPEEDFRWMGPTGLIENPEPWRPVREITLRLRHVYGGGRPRLLISLDARDTPARLRDGEGGREIVVAPEVPVAFDVLRLDSLTHGSPAREGHGDDTRELSLAIAEVRFAYAG
ncbi:hypothetical protein [Roseomonas elaeocarpi]|uniref:Uncharacterized protein n=1 Tax=Roseomonas elaeocarpi TaxID=907779 RepID=A0ABV6JQW2_9PROT